MQVPFYTSTREYHNRKAEFDKAIQEVLEKGDFILGSAVSEFENEVKAYTKSKHAIGVANGSDALVLASDICELKTGTEVLTPVFTFFASTSCFVRLGAKPNFVDVDEETFLMDLHQAENRITKNTRGILPVHLFTQMVDMTRCMDIANKHNLSVIEDAAEAFGMEQKYHGEWKAAGCIGDFGVYSFFPTKTLGGYGDGGMMTTQNDEYFAKAKSLRVHGTTVKYYHDYVGYNSRLDTLQAAILRVKLQKIDEGIEKRLSHANLYRELLKDIDAIKLPVIKGENKPVYYVFTIKAEKRDELAEYLKNAGVGTSIYYPVPLHLQKCFSDLNHKKGDFPVAEKLCTEVIALPMYPELTKEEIECTCEKIRAFYKG